MANLFHLTEHMEPVSELDNWSEMDCCYQKSIRCSLVKVMKSELFREVLYQEIRQIGWRLQCMVFDK